MVVRSVGEHKINHRLVYATVRHLATGAIGFKSITLELSTRLGTFLTSGSPVSMYFHDVSSPRNFVSKKLDLRNIKCDQANLQVPLPLAEGQGIHPPSYVERLSV